MIRYLACALIVVPVGVMASCGSSGSGGGAGPQNDGGQEGAANDGPSVAPGSFTLEVSCNDKVDDVYGDPGKLPDEKGAILKCAHDKDLTKDQLTSGAPDYKGKPFTTGAKIYRVLYRTERGDDAKTAGYSSATVFVPDTPRVAAGSGKLVPVVVTSHGTAGQGGSCAPSRGDQSAYMNYPLVGAGYAVIMPDLAGYANYGAAGNPPSVYAGVSDVGKSTLDGARALRKMFSASVSDKVIIAGHSQGGGTALAALALSDSYGSGGTLAGVVAYAPLWLSQASWGALPALASTYTFKTAPLVNAVAIWYVYTHGELLDGAGHGGDAFKAAKRADVKKFVDGTCESAVDTITQLGNDITDVYDSPFTSALEGPAAFGSQCQDDLCTKWHRRFNDDRPHFTGAQLQVPILLPYGGMDTTIPPDRMGCVIDRLDSDKASYKVCYDPNASHTPIVDVKSDYVNGWIGARTLGEPEPAACPDAFTKTACATPPPNEWP
jgi:alpha-beta hydrolase superfamily lysophospholipase